MSDVPAELDAGGSALWALTTEAHPSLDAAQSVTLLEACRAKDRLDKLDDVLRGDAETWMPQALAQANATANLMKQLLAALRLPDAATGKKPQQRGGARGAYATGAKSGTVSSIDRARAAKSS